MTYTVLLADPAAGVIGVGTASRSPAVGALVPRVDHRVGAAASQGWTNTLASTALAALVAGGSVEAALADAVRADLGRAFRQVGVLDRSGEGAAHTGGRCTPWAGQLVGPGYLVLGNVLAGPQVLAAAEAALLGPLPVDPPTRTVPFIGTDGVHSVMTVPPAVARVGLRIVAALAAAERAGGDARGRLSAALQVRRTGPDPAPALTEIDLRVDRAQDPLDELGLLVHELLYGAPDRSVPWP